MRSMYLKTVKKRVNEHDQGIQKLWDKNPESCIVEEAEIDTENTKNLLNEIISEIF